MGVIDEGEEFVFEFTAPGSGKFPEPELAGMPYKQFLSYLEYRACRLEADLPKAVTFVENTRNGAVSSVPTSHYMLQRELIYHICLQLSVNMPDEFQQFQQMMGGTKSADSF